MSEIKAHEWNTDSPVYALAFMNGSLYSGHRNGKIIQWDANGTKVHEWNTGSEVDALTAMNGLVYSGHYDEKKIIKWDANVTKVHECFHKDVEPISFQLPSRLTWRRRKEMKNDKRNVSGIYYDKDGEELYNGQWQGGNKLHSKKSN